MGGRSGARKKGQGGYGENIGEKGGRGVFVGR